MQLKAVKIDKLQFLSFTFAVLLSITVHIIAPRLGRSFMHQHTKILLKLVQMILEISCFCIFSRWQLATILNFKSINFYKVRTSGGSRHITMPNFLETGPSIAEILPFFDFPIAAATILDFQICKILLAVTVQRADTHHRSKFPQNRSIGCEDIIKIFLFLKMAAVRHLEIVWGHISTTHSEYLGVSITLHYLVMMDEAVFII